MDVDVMMPGRPTMFHSCSWLFKERHWRQMLRPQRPKLQVMTLELRLQSLAALFPCHFFRSKMIWWQDMQTKTMKQLLQKHVQSTAFWWKLRRLPKPHFKVWTVELSNLKLSNVTAIGRHLPSYNQRLAHKLELKTTHIHPTQWIHFGSLLRQLVWLSKSPRPMHDLSKNVLDLVLSFIHVYLNLSKHFQKCWNPWRNDDHKMNAGCTKAQWDTNQIKSQMPSYHRYPHLWELWNPSHTSAF